MAEPGLTRPRVPSGRDAFLDDLIERTEDALDRGEVVRRDLRIAGRTVRLRFASPALVEPMMAALAHAESQAGDEPDLEVDIWDSASARQETLRARWGPEAYLEHGAVDGYFDDEVQMVFSHGSKAITAMFPRQARAIYWLPSSDRFPDVERGSPLRTLLHLWLSSYGDQLVHAAALGHPEGCVLVAGRGGSGKSSTALACLGSGIGHLGDDYCVLEPGDPAVMHILYSSVKARADTVARLGIDPTLVANPDRPEDEKAIVFLAEHEPQRLVRSAPIRAVAFPAVTGLPETTIHPGSAARALRELVPSTIFQLPGHAQPAIRVLGELVRSVPAYELRVGTDPTGVPRALEEMLRI